MNKDYQVLRKQAENLRRQQGLSYNEIRQKVPVSKSTLSMWLKQIRLQPRHRKRLYTKQVQILSRGSQSQKERRAREVEKIIENAAGQISSKISFEALRLIGSAIYWAEGSKGRRTEITNSDPHLILFMVHWINSIFKIPPKNLRGRLNIYSQQNEREIKKFWSDLTGIPTKNFGKSYIKPINKGYKKNNLYYGTMRVEVPKSANMNYQIFGWIKGLLKEIDPYVKLSQKKWRHLSKVQRPPVNLQ